MFERMAVGRDMDGESEGIEATYRLMQDGINHFAPHMSKRKFNCTIQDFCNMLGGGLVSQTTMSAQSLAQLEGYTCGTVIATYTYREEDVVEGNSALPNAGAHTFYIVAWKGTSRALNVMAGKIEADDIKHQLASLGVLRDKIASNKKNEAQFVPAAAAAATGSESKN